MYIIKEGDNMIDLKYRIDFVRLENESMPDMKISMDLHVI